MLVKLKRAKSEYGDLTVGVKYTVLGIEAGDYRILNDRGRPFLYPAAEFSIADAHEPKDWIEEKGPKGERYAYPPAFNKVGFFEDYFAMKPAAMRTFLANAEQVDG